MLYREETDEYLTEGGACAWYYKGYTIVQEQQQEEAERGVVNYTARKVREWA